MYTNSIIPMGKIKKQIYKVFKDYGLKITIKTAPTSKISLILITEKFGVNFLKLKQTKSMITS